MTPRKETWLSKRLFASIAEVWQTPDAGGERFAVIEVRREHDHGSAPRFVRLVTAVVLRSHKMIGSRVARVVLLDLAAQAIANAGRLDMTIFIERISTHGVWYLSHAVGQAMNEVLPQIHEGSREREK